jgi:hypothetical protein
MKCFWFIILLFFVSPVMGQRRHRHPLPDAPPAVGDGAEINAPCGDRNIANHFGEDPKTYTSKTVVYVYDFSQDVTRRKFYKVWQKGGKDFQATPVDMNSESLKPGQDVYLKVVNVNRFLYDVNLSKDPISYEPGPGTLLTKNFLGDSMVLGAWLGAFVNDADIQKLTDDNADLKRLYKKIKHFLVSYGSWDQVALEAYNPCKVFGCCTEVPTLTYSEALKALAEIRTETVDIATLFDQANDLLTKYQGDLKNCQDAQSKLSDLNTAIGKKEPTEEQKKQKEALTKQLQACSDATIASYNEKMKKLTAMVACIGSVTDLLAHLPTEADLKKMTIFLDNMVKSNEEVIFPLEVGPNGMEFYLNVQSRDSIFSYFGLPPYDHPPIHQYVPVLGRAMLNFSLGPFTGFPKYLENVTYAWQRLPDNTGTVGDTGNYILVQSAYTHPVLGLAVMGNLEWKLCSKSLGLGFSGGAGLTIESNPRLTGLAGGSLFLGNWRQVVLTVGVAVLGVNRLANNWQTVADKQVAYTSPQALGYYKELRVGTFVALTFTPFHLSKHVTNGH